MADYDDTNRGALFIADNKQSEKSPDFSGSLNVEGKEYRISGWKKISRAGKKFISVAISEPQSRESAPAKQVSKDDNEWGI